MGIVLLVTLNDFSLQQESISSNIMPVKIFFLFRKMLICPSDIFSSTNVMLLGQVFTMKRCFILSLST